MSAIRYMWVTLGHLRPSGHIMLDMEVIEAQCAWSWRLTIASISSMTGRSGPPRVFRTAELSLFHTASCRFRYSSRASCGVRYPSPE
jgi:hypothetical protein